MPTPEILRTVVTPRGDGVDVELQIDDGSPRDETPGPPITLAVRVASYELPLVAFLQRDALRAAVKVLQELDQRLDRQILDAGPHFSLLNPRLAKP